MLTLDYGLLLLCNIHTPGLQLRWKQEYQPSCPQNAPAALHVHKQPHLRVFDSCLSWSSSSGFQNEMHNFAFPAVSTTTFTQQHNKNRAPFQFICAFSLINASILSPWAHWEVLFSMHCISLSSPAFTQVVADISTQSTWQRFDLAFRGSLA